MRHTRPLVVLILLIAATVARTQTAPNASSAKPGAIALQQLLDADDYIGFFQAMGKIDPTQFSPSQRDYFLGMLAFHLGRFDAAPDYLTQAVNTDQKTLTPHEVETALETLGQTYVRLQRYGAAAQTYDDIDKIFGANLGEGEQDIKANRHINALLQHVPAPSVRISADFTLPRTANEYPVSIPGTTSAKPFMAQLDSGAEFSVLSASTAKAWNVTMLDGTANLHGYGGGAFPAQPGYIPTLVIGTAELHNVAVYVTADQNLYIAQIKHQVNALLGCPVMAALGRLTFAKDGTLTVSAQSPPRDLHASAPLWFAGHSVLIQLDTQPIIADGKVAGSQAPRLFMLDTGSASTYLTDRFLAKHTNIFHGPPPSAAQLVGADGLHPVPAYIADRLPLFAGDSAIILKGNHILAQPQNGEVEHSFGLIGQDTLALFSSYTLDFRTMTLTLKQ